MAPQHQTQPPASWEHLVGAGDDEGRARRERKARKEREEEEQEEEEEEKNNKKEQQKKKEQEAKKEEEEQQHRKVLETLQMWEEAYIAELAACDEQNAETTGEFTCRTDKFERRAKVDEDERDKDLDSDWQQQPSPGAGTSAKQEAHHQLPRVRRATELKALVNSTLATATAEAIKAQGGDLGRGSALLLDGASAGTGAALVAQGLRASRLLSPNVVPSVAWTLRKRGYCSWAGRIETYLQQPLIRSMDLVYLDHTGAFPTRASQIWDIFRQGIVSTEGGLVAATFSTREASFRDASSGQDHGGGGGRDGSAIEDGDADDDGGDGGGDGDDGDDPSASRQKTWRPALPTGWSRAHALYSLVASLVAAADEVGCELIGADKDGLQDYRINLRACGAPSDAVATSSSSANKTDVEKAAMQETTSRSDDDIASGLGIALDEGDLTSLAQLLSIWSNRTDHQGQARGLAHRASNVVARSASVLLPREGSSSASPGLSSPPPSLPPPPPASSPQSSSPSSPPTHAPRVLGECWIPKFDSNGGCEDVPQGRPQAVLTDAGPLQDQDAGTLRAVAVQVLAMLHSASKSVGHPAREEKEEEKEEEEEGLDGDGPATPAGEKSAKSEKSANGKREGCIDPNLLGSSIGPKAGGCVKNEVCMTEAEALAEQHESASPSTQLRERMAVASETPDAGPLGGTVSEGRLEGGSSAKAPARFSSSSSSSPSPRHSQIPSVEPSRRNPSSHWKVFRRSVLLYPEQMMFILLRVQKKRP